MTCSSMSERGTPPGKKSSLMILLLLLVSLFAVGCGDSGEDFVVQGNNANNNPQVPTTTVNFQFARAQQVNITANVPVATTKLHIDFLASDSSEVFETDVDFSPTVSVSGVPITATQAQVTALDSNGIPLRTIFYSLTLTAGQTANAVPLGPGFPVTFQSVTASPNPLFLAVNGTQQLVLGVNFSNGNTLSGTAAGGTASFSSADTSVATVSSTGLVRGVTNGTTTVNVNYSLNNVTRNSTVVVDVSHSGGGGGGGTGNVTVNRLIASPTTVALTNTTTSQKITTTFFPANSTTGETVSATGTLGSFTGGVNATNLTFVSTTGNVTSSAAVNGTATLTLSYTPTGGSAVTATVPITVTRAGSGGGSAPVGNERIEVNIGGLLNASSVKVAPGGTTAPITVFYFAPNSSTGTLLTTGFSTSFTNLSPNTFAPVFNTTNNRIGAGNGLAGNTVNLVIDHVTAGGTAIRKTIAVTVAGDATDAISARIAAPNGATLKMVNGMTFPVVVLETRANGVQVRGTFGAAANQYTASSSNAAAATIAAGTNAIVAQNTATEQTTTVTVQRTSAFGSTTIAPSTLGTFTATVFPNTVTTATPGANVTITAPGTAKAQSELQYSVQVAYSNGQSQSVTPTFLVTAGGNLTLRDDVDRFDGPTVFRGTALAGAAGSGTLTLGTAQNGLVIPGQSLGTATTTTINS